MAKAKATESEFQVGVLRAHKKHWDFIASAVEENEPFSTFIREGALALAEKRTGKKRPDAPVPTRGTPSESSQAAAQLGLTSKQFAKYSKALAVALANGKAAPKPTTFREVAE